MPARAAAKRVKTPNGAGSVTLRSDGRWMARYTTTDPATGQAARKALYGRTEQEALVGRAWCREYGDLVFTEADGTPLNGIYVTKRFQRALEDAKLPKIRFHDLRHAAATFMAVEKVPVAITMAVLGHANASTTLEIYTRVAPELAREAAEAMDRVLGSSAPPHTNRDAESVSQATFAHNITLRST
jgi:integrase